MTRDERKNSAERVMLTVPSHPRFLYVVRSALYPLVIDVGFRKREARQIILAVDEACSNIIKYAYEGDHTKEIRITITVHADLFTVTLQDFGKKADASTIVPRNLEDVRPGGLGTHFIGTVFDAVRYDTNQEQGTILTLEKKRVRP